MARSSPMTIGIIGTGEASKRATTALLDDHTEAAKELTLIFPFTPDHLTENIRALVRWAIKYKIPFEAVTTDDALEDDDDALMDKAVTTHKVTRVPHKIVSLLERASGTRQVLAFWSDEDPDCVKTLERAEAKDIEVLDLTDGLQKIVFVEDGDGVEETGSDSGPEVAGALPEDDAEATPRRRRRTAPADDEDATAATEPAAPAEPTEKPARRSRARKSAATADEAQAGPDVAAAARASVDAAFSNTEVVEAFRVAVTTKDANFLSALTGAFGPPPRV